jgi:hypothetical protein
MENKSSLKDLVYKRLKEMSATGGGAGAAAPVCRALPARRCQGGWWW